MTAPSPLVALLDQLDELHSRVIRDDPAAEWLRLTLEHDAIPQLTAAVRAELDELAGDYPSPAHRMAALENYTAELSAYVQELEDLRPPTGRHAHTGEMRAAA